MTKFKFKLTKKKRKEISHNLGKRKNISQLHRTNFTTKKKGKGKRLNYGEVSDLLCHKPKLILNHVVLFAEEISENM